jgi:hypothetical protein
VTTWRDEPDGRGIAHRRDCGAARLADTLFDRPAPAAPRCSTVRANDGLQISSGADPGAHLPASTVARQARLDGRGAACSPTYGRRQDVIGRGRVHDSWLNDARVVQVKQDAARAVSAAAADRRGGCVGAALDDLPRLKGGVARPAVSCPGGGMISVLVLANFGASAT